MKVLLIKLAEPVGKNMKATYMPPIGLWSIRDALQWWGHEVDVLDLHLDNGAFSGYKYKEPPDLIGISAQFSTQHRFYENMARWCRAMWPEARIVAGGFHAAAVPTPYGVDEVCRGAGETFFDPSGVPSLRPTAEDMGPYWEKSAPHDLRSITPRWMPVETSRGCGRDCEFCGVPRFWGKWKGCGVDVDHLAGQGIQELFIEDDNFAWNPHRATQMLDRFNWYNMVYSFPNGIEIKKALPLLESMKGCWRMSLPFETGSEYTAKLMRLGSKWMPHEEAVEAVKQVNGYGIESCGFFIIGYPGETTDDIKRTLDYANSLPLHDRHIYVATPYPGTRLYRLCREKGYLKYDGAELCDHLQYTEGMIDTPEWSGEEVVEIRNADREAAIARRKG